MTNQSGGIISQAESIETYLNKTVAGKLLRRARGLPRLSGCCRVKRRRAGNEAIGAVALREFLGGQRSVAAVAKTAVLQRLCVLPDG